MNPAFASEIDKRAVGNQGDVAAIKTVGFTTTASVRTKIGASSTRGRALNMGRKLTQRKGRCYHFGAVYVHWLPDTEESLGLPGGVD